MAPYSLFYMLVRPHPMVYLSAQGAISNTRSREEKCHRASTLRRIDSQTHHQRAALHSCFRWSCTSQALQMRFPPFCSRKVCLRTPAFCNMNLLETLSWQLLSCTLVLTTPVDKLCVRQPMGTFCRVDTALTFARAPGHLGVQCPVARLHQAGNSSACMEPFRFPALRLSPGPYLSPFRTARFPDISASCASMSHAVVDF